ncbi:Blood vessel epicardial substance-like protein, partial [Operophtera brumata]
MCMRNVRHLKCHELYAHEKVTKVDSLSLVSIMAMEESRVLVWHRDKLKLSIMSDAFLQSVFDHVLGRDVVHKLM